MSSWSQRLPVTAAAVTLGSGAVGGLLTFLLLEPEGNTEWLATQAIAVLCSSVGAASWAAAEARTLRAVAQAATTALSGRGSSAAKRNSLSESVVVVDAVNALVERAERNTRELSQRQAYAAVGDFATELARELAPSVQSARSSLRALEVNLHTDSPLHPPLDRALRELHRLSNTLQDTLRLARSGKLSTRTLDLWLPVRAAYKTAAQDAITHRVLMDPPPHGTTPIWVHGDSDALEQLFLNLLVNGVQNTESGGRVSVNVAVKGDVSVTITDTGCGIPDGALDRVFEPFYTTKPDRAGLGLAIAWRTAAAHGGKLSIESAMNRGTTVHVSLPVVDSAGGFTLE